MFETLASIAIFVDKKKILIIAVQLLKLKQRKKNSTTSMSLPHKNSQLIESSTNPRIPLLKSTKAQKFEKCHLIGGSIAAIASLVSWVILAEALQALETDYSRPYFLRWVVTSCYMFTIFEYLITRWIVKQMKSNINSKNTHPSNSHSSSKYGSHRSSKHLRGELFEDNDKPGDGKKYKYKDVSFYHKCKQLVIPAILMNISDIFGGYLWYKSLESTSVGVNNTIYQSQAAFTYIGSIFVLGSRMTCQKNIGVIISFAGVVLVSLIHEQGSGNNGNNDNSSSINSINNIRNIYSSSDSDDSSSVNTISGIIECLTSSVLYATYEIGIKYFGNRFTNNSNDEAASSGSRIENALLFQFMVGVTAFLFYWPIILIFDYTDIEKFELPYDRDSWLSILIPCILDLILHSSLFVGITLLNSEILAFSQLFVIPLSFALDFMLHGYIITTYAIFGSILIVVSFIVMEGPQCRISSSNKSAKRSITEHVHQ